jgi:hypothetical protein
MSHDKKFKTLKVSQISITSNPLLHLFEPYGDSPDERNAEYYKKRNVVFTEQRMKIGPYNKICTSNAQLKNNEFSIRPGCSRFGDVDNVHMLLHLLFYMKNLLPIQCADLTAAFQTYCERSFQSNDLLNKLSFAAGL